MISETVPATFSGSLDADPCYRGARLLIVLIQKTSKLLVAELRDDL